MFVRRKKNRSGTTTVVVVDKSHGMFREIHNLGTSSDPDEIDRLCSAGRKWIAGYGGQRTLDLFPEESLVSSNQIFDSIEELHHDGAYRLLEKIYNSIGFDTIGDKTLKDLVIARICDPMSKLATTDYMRRQWGEDYHYQQIYRYLDLLNTSLKEPVLKLSVEHTREILGGVITMAFYDVTTLYFESFREDGLRAPGFSKDGKTAETQVVLGLLVSRDGYPLAYSLFNGSQFEGRTMIPVVDDFIQRYGIRDFVLVADAGLMSDKNLALLRQAGYRFVIGARIRKESKPLTEWILSLQKAPGAVYEKTKPNNDRLIVSWSEKRAEKDAFNRKRGVARLEKAYRSGRITKDKINKRGYNKFLHIDKDVRVSISRDKIEEDAKWDGWKGYLTNTELSPVECISQYHGLRVVERAFRISKGTLDMRPMFHFTEKRIEAHVCLCFIALKVYKELDRQLKAMKSKLSIDKVLAIAKSVSTLTLRLPSGEKRSRTLFITAEQKKVESIFDALGV